MYNTLAILRKERSALGGNEEVSGVLFCTGDWRVRVREREECCC